MKVRVHEIAKELGIKSKDALDKAKELGMDVKTASSAVEPDHAEKLIHFIMTGEKPEMEALAPTPPEKPAVKVEKETSPKAEQPKPAHKEESKPVPSETPAPKSEVKTAPEVPEEKKEEIPPQKEAKETVPKPVEKQEAPKPATHSEQVPPNELKEPKKPEPIKEKPISETPQRESLAQATVRKRRGLVIVKKKRAVEAEKKPEPVSEDTRPEKTKKFKPLSLDDSPLAQLKNLPIAEESAIRKKKKQKKHTPHASRKEAEQKIDILAERQFSDRVSVEDENENEVMLLDFSLNDEIKAEERKKQEQPPQDRVRVQRKNPFMEQGIRRRSRRKKRPKRVEKTEEVVGVVEIPEDVRVYEFAEKIGKSISEVITVLFKLGVMVTKNDFLDNDALEILADEFDVEIEISDPLKDVDYVSTYDEEEDTELATRPPVVTIMGHVDHGKTSLLDYIRNTRVADGEAGGITQHIGAYMVERDGKKISFIDTPGHEAFTEMRARGAQITDVAIIVVAADDGVQPQTQEALNHAKAAEIPIVIAVNKIDKPEANPDLIMSQMAEQGYTPVDWGGEYEFVKISAKTGEGIDDLLENVLIQAELLELQANPNRMAKAVVVESSLEKGKGVVATVVVQNGTLNQGDSVVVDTTYGRIRALTDDMGKAVKQIGPSEMAMITGLGNVPPAGSVLIAVEDDATARAYAETRAEHVRQKELSKSTKVSFDELAGLAAEGKLKTLPVIIKSDVQGSLEAIRGSLEKLKNEEVKINIIHSGVGGITESDLTLANASDNTIILGFNVRPTGTVKEKAKDMGIQVRTYSIIYDLIDDVKALLSGMMSPIIEEENTGQAEVRDTFAIPKAGTIAGCFVTDGTINRNIKVRVIREGVVIYDSSIASLKRFKDDVNEVSKGYECGIMIDNFNDIKVGDVLETFKEVERKRNV